MPSVTQEEPVPHPPRKRRRDDDGGPRADGGLQLYDALTCRKPVCPAVVHSCGGPRQLQTSEHHQHQHHHHWTNDAQLLYPDQLASNPLLSRKVLPSIQAPKRLRLGDDDGPRNPGRDQRRVMAVPYSRQQHKASPDAPHEATSTPQGPELVASPQTGAGSHAPARTPSALAPCHICSRRPTKKSDLDSFADCEGCGLRTCYVCMRECLGWGGVDTGDGETPSAPDDRRDGSDAHDPGSPVWPRGGNDHRQMVCSRCCIEQGADGDVICLGCLQRR